MNVKLLLPAALLALCLGCPGAGGGKPTPEACYEAIRQALRDKDLAAYYFAHAPEIRTEILVDEQLCAENRARRARKLDEFKKLETDYGVGQWSRKYGTLMRELRYGNNTASVIVTISHPEGTTGRPRLRVVKRCEHTEFCAGPPKAG